ncbi:hypothetical protein SLS60_010731 [Paraconiothyrium brasiliense]|uniref:Alpha-glucosidase n=1 Tax=Paraconiothyrium brasiliense TaxID=300254 RepID=A0ABR3QLV1_9PLEO
MPAPFTMLRNWLLLGSALLQWTQSAPLRRADDCPGYKASNVQKTDGGITADLALAGAECNVYGTDLHDLKFEASYQTDSRLHVIIYDKDEQVYQVPDFVLPRPMGSATLEESQVEITIEESPFSFTVTRKANKEVIFTTKGSQIVFEDQYIRLRTSLPEDPYLYGLGEHTDPLRLPTSDYVRTMWNRDAGGVPQRSNLYGQHPVYFERRDDYSHGVFLLNSNGMDILINNDDGQYLEYNTVGGVIDLYFLAGPSAMDVAREYSEVTSRAQMMPYWGFGFHQCRFGYKSADEVAAVIANYSAANIPLETMWTDIDYMDSHKVFTLGENFPIDKMRSLVSSLHANDQHYIVMVDPAVAYQDYDAFNNGKEADIFLKNSSGAIYQGVVWPGVTAFPDWFHEKTQDYWNNEFATFFDAETGVDIDALWIDMNEPSNFCEWPCDNPGASAKRSVEVRQDSGSRKGLPNRNLLDPKYQIHNEYGVLSNKTARTDIIHQGGWAEYGDNISAWDQYIISIRHLLQFVSIFQIPMAGADVCGFLMDTTESLCARWTTLGAFYPFYRNHNVDGAISQEAYRWESVAAAARKAIDLRYRLLDYMYTAMHLQSTDGTPMLAPVWMHYSNDPATLSIDAQFFFGPALLVSPVTEKDSDSVTFYLPDDIFWDFHTLKRVTPTAAQTTYSNLSTSDIPVHIKCRNIIPLRVASANTTTALRKEDFELIVAPNGEDKAWGKLYLDDGVSLEQEAVSEIEFTYDGGKLKMDGTFRYDAVVGIKTVTVLGDGDAEKYQLDEKLTGAWEHDVKDLKKSD